MESKTEQERENYYRAFSHLIEKVDIKVIPGKPADGSHNLQMRLQELKTGLESLNSSSFLSLVNHISLLYERISLTQDKMLSPTMSICIYS